MSNVAKAAAVVVIGAMCVYAYALPVAAAYKKDSKCVEQDKPLDVPGDPKDNKNVEGKAFGGADAILKNAFSNAYKKKEQPVATPVAKTQSGKDKHWRAAMRVMAEYHVAHADKDKGEIRTEKIKIKEFDKTETHSYVITVHVEESKVTVEVKSETDTKEHCCNLSCEVHSKIMEKTEAH
ncbi:MAG: hypothetical protein LBJ69_01640 [Holosporales bacterium]|jgi:hypothetical protein|nr:hypothetical protein [Holosporales bacterium]